MTYPQLLLLVIAADIIIILIGAWLMHKYARRA